MSAKLIIYVSGKPLIHGHKRREFLWSVPHGCYLYGGKEIAASDFNEVYARVMRNSTDMNPLVKVIADGAMEAVTVVKYEPAPKPREITLEDALAVVQRLDPDRLKKSAGRRPAQPAVAAGADFS